MERMVLVGKRIDFYLIFILIIALFLNGCKPSPVEDSTTPQIDNTIHQNDSTQVQNNSFPTFSADSAFAHIEKQLEFGPRIPNSKGHKNCGDFLINKLKQYSDHVLVQQATVTAYTGEALNIRNIIARFDKENSNRIVLYAHWDTRPFADRDPSNNKKPVMGADDGASGVGVLIEIARLLKEKNPGIGVDIILFDGEDYGDAGGAPETYCLGSQYWAKNPPIPGYYAKYGILLDMVGAANARFCKEGWSMRFAPGVVEKVWSTAQSLGFGNYFINKMMDPITDDHYFVNTLARIPSIDIINFDNENSTVGFAPHWHTLNDDINIIDKNTLHAVGTTLSTVIFTEKNNL